MRLIIGTLLYVACFGALTWMAIDLKVLDKPVDEVRWDVALVGVVSGVILYVFGFFPNTNVARRRKARLGAQQRRPRHEPFDIDAFEAAQEAMRGLEDRASKLPAYALSFHSPFDPPRASTSWLGGTPKAPPGLVWPRDQQGAPLAFMGQFDLSAIRPVEGLRPAGLPEDGAMLVFITAPHKIPTQVLRFVSAEDMARSEAIAPPEDMLALSELGFWVEETLFPVWPVDFVPYVDAEGVCPPDELTFETPVEDWLTTWGLAAFEAEMLLKAFEADASQRQSHEATKAHLSPEQQEKPNFKRLAAYHQMMEQQSAAVIAAVEAFHDEAQRFDPEATVSQDRLAAVLGIRRELSDALDGFSMKQSLVPRPGTVAGQLLRRKVRDEPMENVYARVPDGCRDFLSSHIRAWRGHRLFGRDIPEATVEFDLRGRDCVLVINADPLLATQTEHENGFSIWGLRAKTAEGDWTAVASYWHTNV